MTLVPGTFSDLGDAADYVAQNDKVLNRADELSPGNNVAITWASYESPNTLLPGAAFSGYAENAHGDLSNFQEGLRATHQGEAPSHNTLIGHSYGSTVVGEAASNGGSHSDDIVFLGSPGVGVDSADQLGVPKDHVWAAKSESDVIDWTPSTDPLRWAPTVSGESDYARYGLDPTDPKFGGNVMPTDPSGGHGDYWDKAPSRESMARIMTGTNGQGS
jgi:pimeloyl-ACP methyl ester carboxylesterase